MLWLNKYQQLFFENPYFRVRSGTNGLKELAGKGVHILGLIRRGLCFVWERINGVWAAVMEWIREAMVYMIGLFVGSVKFLDHLPLLTQLWYCSHVIGGHCNKLSCYRVIVDVHTFLSQARTVAVIVLLSSIPPSQDSSVAVVILLSSIPSSHKQTKTVIIIVVAADSI